MHFTWKAPAPPNTRAAPALGLYPFAQRIVHVVPSGTWLGFAAQALPHVPPMMFHFRRFLSFGAFAGVVGAAGLAGATGGATYVHLQLPDGQYPPPQLLLHHPSFPVPAGPTHAHFLLAQSLRRTRAPREPDLDLGAVPDPNPDLDPALVPALVPWRRTSSARRAAAVALPA